MPLTTDEKAKSVHIYGDYYNADTRALLVICKFADLEPNFTLVDTLKRENKKSNFLNINPSGLLPVIYRHPVLALT